MFPIKFLKKEYYCDCYITQIKVNEVRVNKSFFDECLIEDEVVKDSKEDEKEDEKNDSELDKVKEEELEKERLEKVEKERLEKEEKEKKDKEEKQSELTLKEKEHEILSQTLNNLADEIQTLRKELES